MSRRPTPSQAAQNQQTIKNLLKLDCNKICADCKRNKRKWTLGPSPFPRVRDSVLIAPPLLDGEIGELDITFRCGICVRG